MPTKKIQHKFNPRATYFQGYKIPKKIVMWVPPIVEEEYFNDPSIPSIMEFVYFIEAAGVKRIDTTLYEGSFQNFYDYHLNKYNKIETSFCATTSEGGVSTDYIVNSADSEYDNDRTITLISVDIDDVDNITEVYALVTFRLIDLDPDTIMVETLCGNRSLPPSGEGTRLINYLTDLAYLISVNKIALHPIDSAIGYYTRLNFIELTKDEADAINDEEDTITFRKNTRARKNWKKSMNAVRFSIQQQKMNELKRNQIIIKELYKKKRGIPIGKPFSKEKQSPRIPKPARKVKNIEKHKNGDITVTRVAYRIIPGKSLRVAKMKSEIKDAAQMTKIIQENSKQKLSPIKEESNSPEELTEEEIEQQARQFRNEERMNAIQHFTNVQKQSRPDPVIISAVDEDDTVYEDEEKEKDDVERVKNRKKTVSKTIKKHKNSKKTAKGTRKR